jgi:hypothetical protein
MARLGSLTVLVALCMPAQALDHHPFHAQYKSWVNKDHVGCCNDNDCQPLSSENERETASGGVEVRVEGTWCPVYAVHYLRQGNAPDWSTSHVCVRKQIVPAAVPVCARLLCYQPKPGT